MSAQAKKVALITGANKGIGFETARQLGQLGMTVLVAARDAKKATEAAAKLTAEGVDAQGIVLDVTKEADREAAAASIEKQFGKLDILVNNAGVAGETDQWGVNTTLTVKEADIRRIFETNFFAVIALTEALVPLLKKSEAGRIVNLSSILGSLTLHSDPASPIYGSKAMAYDTSKTALNAYTVHLAHALKETKIKANAAHPGWVKTDMGTDAAPMEIQEGAKTSVALATLGEDGPTGGYFHLGQTLPW